MSSGERTIKIKFDGTSKGLTSAAAKARAELKALQTQTDENKKRFEGFVSGAAGVAQNVGLMATKVAALSGGLNIVVSLVSALGAMSGVLGLIPAAAFGGVASILALKLGADGIKKAFQGLNPTLDAFKAKVSKGFEQGLTPAVSNLKVILPQLSQQFSNIGLAMGGVLTKVTIWAKTPAAIGQLNTILKGTWQVIQNVGAAFAPLIAAFVRVGAVGMPILVQLTGGIGAAADRFNQFVQRAADSGQLEKWIQGGIAAFQQLFHMIGQVGDILSTVFFTLKNAGVGLGGVLGPVLDQIQAFVHSAEGQAAIVAFAQAINQVGQAVGQVLGAALKAVGPMLPGIAKALGDVATIAAQTLVPVIERLAPILQKLIDGFNGLPGPVKDVIVQLGLLAFAFKKLNIGKLLDFVPGLRSAFSKGEPEIEAGTKRWGGKLKSGLTSVASEAGKWGIGALIGNEILTDITGHDFLQEGLNEVGSWFGKEKTNPNATAEKSQALQGIAAKLDAAKNSATGLSTSLQGVSTNLGNLSGAATVQMGAFAGAVASGAGSAATAMGAQVGAMVGQTGATMAQLPGIAGVQTGGFAGAVAAGSGSAAAIMGGNVGAMVGQTAGGLGQLPGIAGGQMGAMAGAISNVGGAAVGAAQGVAGGVSGALNGVNLYGAGVNIMEGLAAGMKAQAAAAYAAARSIAAGVAAAARGALGIASPSKVMAEQVGRWIPAGIGQGVWKYRATALDSVTQLTNQLRSAAGATSAVGAGLGNVVKWGDVSEGVWDQLLAAGWKGNPNDQMEALYRPADSTPAPAGGQTINLTLDLGSGIQQAIQVQIDANNRATVRALTAGSGANR